MRLCVVAALVSAGCRTGQKTAKQGEVPPIERFGEGDFPMPGGRIQGQEERGLYAVVYFDYDSAQVRESERAKVDQVAAAMRSGQGLNIVVEGHCDERGGAEYNLALGERRALAIRAYLVGLGVEEGRIHTRSLGEEQPAAVGFNEEAWRLNRRGEFVEIR